MRVVAIDPGMTGAAAYIDESGSQVIDLPLMRDGALAWIDCHDLMRALIEWREDSYPKTIFIERQSARPGQGVSSTFKSGVILGSILACAQACAYSIHFVTAAAWKRALGLSDDKNASLDKARLLYPLMELERKKDHNRAEALLIAHYGRTLITELHT